jgi:hypothetical protein
MVPLGTLLYKIISSMNLVKKSILFGMVEELVRMGLCPAACIKVDPFQVGLGKYHIKVLLAGPIREMGHIVSVDHLEIIADEISDEEVGDRHLGHILCVLLMNEMHYDSIVIVVIIE